MAREKQPSAQNQGFFRPLRRLTKYFFGIGSKKPVNVYFISGMCYNCKVFDRLRLPDGFSKKYLEWNMPEPAETLGQYTRTMALGIDSSRPFVLVGYSFGAIIMQEMNKFLHPHKSIVISSFKNKSEIPKLFHRARKVHLAERIPMKVYSSTEFITNAFNKFVYHTPNEKIAEFMVYTDPVYVKWAMVQITNWTPEYKTEHLYHIHGTADQIFPFKLIKNVFPVKDGDHLMVYEKADKVSSILSDILLKKED